MKCFPVAWRQIGVTLTLLAPLTACVERAGSTSEDSAITGNFKGDGKIGYARLGGASSSIFVHR
jgi:hypothetical protein